MKNIKIWIPIITLLFSFLFCARHEVRPLTWNDFTKEQKDKFIKDSIAAANNNSTNTTPGENMSGEIVIYNNITLGGLNMQKTTGVMFSTKTGLSYNESQVTTSSASNIDIVYVGSGGLSFFESPASSGGWGITTVSGLASVLITNYVVTSSGPNLSISDFDSMTDDSKLKNLNIIHDNQSFSLSGLPIIILFKNQFNKKGAIKVKSGVSGRSGYIVFDVKVQK